MFSIPIRLTCEKKRKKLVVVREKVGCWIATPAIDIFSTDVSVLVMPTEVEGLLSLLQVQRLCVVG